MMIPRQYTKKRKSHRDESFQSRTKDLQTNIGNNFFNFIDDYNDDINSNGNDEKSNDDSVENEVENHTTESSSTSSTSSRRSNILSDESSSIDHSDDQIKSRVIDFNSSVLFDDRIDVLRMSQDLFELRNLANRIGHQMKEIQISSCDRSRSQYEVAKKLWDWKGNSKLSNEGLKELLEILEWAGVKGLPHINDMKQGVGCIPEVPDLGNIDSLLCFQQCPNSCMVYKGYNSTELQCAVCESPRFAACAKCYGLECSCLMNRRTPLKTFYYSSLIFYLRDKLSQKTAANFVMALKTEVVKVKDNHINDTSDGVSVRKALKNMVSTFEDYCNKKSRELIMVNLLLGGYYDGAQLYKNQVASFWPAGISILNLPPSYRFKEGIGFHLLALFMGKTPSAAEDYLFRSCVGEELKLLNHGIIIADKYFVQARLVISVMDTKAQQHFSRFQSVGSCSACPSCGFRGTWVGTKAVYTDHRKYLGWNHAYRAIGQSLQCCPEHQYSNAPQNSKNLAERGRFWTNIESLHPNSEELRYVSKIISTSDGREDIDERENLAESVCDKEQGGDIDKIFSDIMPDGHDFLFYHNHKKPGSDSPTFSYTDFNASMYFINCYYKDYKRDERISEKELRTRMQESDDVMFENKRKRRKQLKKPLHKLNRGSLLKKPENGCHGSFALSDAPVSIQSFQIWDPFHVLPNVTNRLINLLSGTTMFSINTKELCKLVGMHPSVAIGNRLGSKGKTIHPWQITQNNMNLLDGLINSCLTATGYGNDFQLRYLFKQGGFINSASKIQLLVIMLPVLAAFSELPETYQQFIRMLHHDIVYLFRPFFEGPEEIDMLFLLMVETVVTYEGLFPISEHIHGFHQLVCLVKQLKEFGPIRNLMGAVMERALKSIKSVNPNGGQSPFRSQLNKYMALTKQRHGRAFRFKIRLGKIISSSHVRRAGKMHREINDPCFISAVRDGDAYHIRYNDAKVCLWNEASARRCEKVMMDHEKVETFFEQSLFIEALLHEIKRQGEEGNSSLYKASNFLRDEISISSSITWKTLAAVDSVVDEGSLGEKKKSRKKRGGRVEKRGIEGVEGGGGRGGVGGRGMWEGGGGRQGGKKWVGIVENKEG